jgi:hypothetical protein
VADKPLTRDHGKPLQQSRSKLGKFSRKHRILRFLVYLTAFLALVFIALAEDRSSTPENSQKTGYLKILSSDFWYEQMVGKPQPPAQYVAVIVISKDIPTIIDEDAQPRQKEASAACNRRIYLAELLKALSDLSPRVVVLDMWFSPDSCSEAESQPLWDALNQLSTRIPVVYGLGSYSLSDSRSLWPAEIARLRSQNLDLKSTELILMPMQHPPILRNANISEGVVELDSNPRSIPLSWPVYDTFEIAGKPGELHRLDSLSIASVRAFDSRSAVLIRVGALSPDGSAKASADLPPHTSFLREEDLPIAGAIDIICLSPRNHFWESTCQSIAKGSLDRQVALAGKVVLIGLTGMGDVHQSQIGNVPGVILQAEYVESLLQNRVYRSIPIVYQVAVGFAWLFAIVWVSQRLFSNPGWGRFFSFVAVFFIPACLIDWFFVHFKYYTEFFFPPFLAVLVLISTRLIEHFLSRNEEMT